MAALAGDTKIELVDGGYVPGATRLVDEAYDYTDADQIGEGTYGKVYKGTDKQGDKVALKMIRMDNEKEGFPITAIREIKLLSTLKHENIVNLREIVRSRVNKESKYKGDIFMVFDYAEHDLTGLMDAVKHRQSLSIPQVKCIMQQLLRGLAYCHSNGILHRDLKASNLLIDRHGTLKIADFGLARNFATEHSGKLTNRVITLWYRPPELLLGAERYGPEVDVWSVGCIFAELLAKKPLFPGNNESAQLDCIFRLMGVPTEDTWPGVSSLTFYENVKHQNYSKDNRRFRDWCKEYQVPQDAQVLLNELLALDPAKRIKAIDAATHPYFYNQLPAPCKPNQLPKLPDCHEWTTKNKRKQQQQQHGGHHGHHHGQHHHSQHSGGYMPQHGMPPGGPAGYGMPPGMHPGAPPAAAAAGYRPGDQRNVRPRMGGVPGGGMYGHPPPGPGIPPRQGAGYPPAGGGFKPAAARPGYPQGPGGFAPPAYTQPPAAGHPPPGYGGAGMPRGGPGQQGRPGWQQQQHQQGYGGQRR